MNKICSFFGHRDTFPTSQLIARVTSIVQALIVDEGVDTFYFGGFGQFDDMCHEIVTLLRVDYPDIVRVYCLSDPRHLRPGKRPDHIKTSDYEHIIYVDLDHDYWYTRIYYRNCNIIMQSYCSIFYVTHAHGGAYKCLQYAKSKRRYIVEL